MIAAIFSMTMESHMRQLTDLKFYSRNINGLNKWKARAINLELHKLNIQIAFLQETHLDTTTATRTYTKIFKDWTCHWGLGIRDPKPHAQGRHGVAILIHQTVLHNAFTFTLRDHAFQNRLLMGVLEGAGIRLLLGSLYLPVGHTSGDFRDFETCCQILRDNTLHIETILGGDMNFLSHPRDCSSVLGDQRKYSNQRKHQLWQQYLPPAKFAEIQKDLLQDQAAYTHHHLVSRKNMYYSKSRLDRFYASNTTHAVAFGSCVLQNSQVKADHMAIMIQILLPNAILIQPKRGRYKIPEKFCKDLAYRNQFKSIIQKKLIGLPQQGSLYQQWTAIKQIIAKSAIALNRKYRREEQRKWEALNQNETHTSTFLQHQAQYKYAQLHTDKLHSWDDATEAHGISPAAIYKEEDPYLLNRGGLICKEPQECANLLVQHYATISSAKPLSQNIKASILDTLTAEDAQVFPNYEFPESITEEDVKQALKRMKPTAPGKDGLRIRLYKVLKEELAPILVKLYTAILQEMPQDFLEGVIIPIYKQKGSKHEPINYRPITLLNTDYRILTQILLAKIREPLQQLIGPTQTAFLPGRNLMDNIWNIQLTARYLSLRKESYWLAICDFEKAYDKIDQNFLFQCCQSLNMPTALLNWIVQILTNTRNRVHYHDTYSVRREFTAGVRQGDPISPYLYLLISHVMSRWLEYNHIGIELSLNWRMETYYHKGLTSGDFSIPLAAICYADDTNVFLKEYQIKRFCKLMDFFARGTGQCLNVNKTKLLPIGHLPAEIPRELAGLQVVPEAKILGFIVQQGTGSIRLNWDKKIIALTSAISYLRHSPLSPFSKYKALSMIHFPKHILHGVELHKPSARQIKVIWTQTRKLLHSQGWKSSLFANNVNYGGLGCLPLEEHIRARELKCAISLFTQGPRKIWIQLAWHLFLGHAQSLRRDLRTLPLPLQLLLDPPKIPEFELIPNDTEAYQPPYFVFPRQEGMPIYTMEDLIRGILAQQNGRLECYPNMDLGWVISGKVCCLTEYTVKQGTSLLRRQQHAQQFVKILEWYDFITPLSVRLDYDPLHCLEDVSRILRPIRQLPIPSIYKLPFWETLNNAQVNAELIHKDQPCIC